MRITPSISFNLNNDYERGLYDYAMEQDKYFSAYVKRLIDRDRASRMIGAAPVNTMTIPAPEEPSMKFTKAALKAFT